MSSTIPRRHLEVEYYNAAQAYLRSLPPEHFMEATPQATQRKITLESLDLVTALRPEVQVFNELLVQYKLPESEKIHPIVPDNMVVVCSEQIEAEGSYDVELQPVGPFWVLEYVSKSSRRKDYQTSFQKYEEELKVPYYLVFYPEIQELTLFHRGSRKKKYSTVKPNQAGRYSIPELDLEELALLDGWVRYWYRGQLLPLPAELQRDLEAARQQLQKAQEETKLAQEEAKLAQEEAKLAQEEANKVRQQNERLLARFRELGIDPDK